MSSERYARRRALQRTLRPATRKRLQHLVEDAADLAPAILKDVVMHNLTKPFRQFIQTKAPWLGNVKLSHRLGGGEYKEVPIVRQRATERRRRKQRYRSRKQRDQAAPPDVQLKDYLNKLGEYDAMFDKYNKSRKKDNAASSSCDSNCSCRSSSSCSTCSSTGSERSPSAKRVRKSRRPSRSFSSSPETQQPMQATFDLGNNDYRLGVPIPDPKLYIHDFFNPPSERKTSRKNRRDASRRDATRRRKSKSSSYSPSTSSSSSEAPSRDSKSSSKDGYDTATSRHHRRERHDSSSESGSDRPFLSKLFRPNRRQSRKESNISVEDLSSPSQASSPREARHGPGDSGSEQDTANDSPAIVDRTKIPPTKLYRRKSFKHDIDRTKKTERRARSVHYQTSDRPVANDIQAFKNAAEAQAQAEALARAADEARNGSPLNVKSGLAERLNVPTTSKSRRSAFKEHLSSEEDLSQYAGMLQDVSERRKSKKDAEKPKTTKDGRRSSMDRKEEEVTNTSSGAAS